MDEWERFATLHARDDTSLEHGDGTDAETADSLLSE
jgi:hypothetical protein